MNPPIGSFWDKPSLVWGREAGEGEVADAVSPLGPTIQQFRLLSDAELDDLFAARPAVPPIDLTGPCQRLAEILEERRDAVLTTMRLANGFSSKDCQEMLEGALQLIREFNPATSPLTEPIPFGKRQIELARVPFGTIAVVLPQNAFLLLCLTCLLSALSTGNRIILRAPTVAGRSAGALARALVEAGFDPRSFSIVVCDARRFIGKLLTSPQKPLLHFMGGSRRGAALLSQTFDAGCPCIVDGDGNGWVYIDEDYDPVLAASEMWQGAIRYSGQTCTSVNGVFVHPAIDAPFRAALRDLVAGTPSGKNDEPIGPLFSADQSAYFEEAIQASGGRIGRNGHVVDSVMPGTLIEDPFWESSIVSEGLFAPALWVRTGEYSDLVDRWPLNRYPMTAGVLSYSIEQQRVATDLTGAARIVMNGDPSIEHVLEPWGGYPSSGLNPVGPWVDKYTRVVQIDREL